MNDVGGTIYFWYSLKGTEARTRVQSWKFLFIIVFLYNAYWKTVPGIKLSNSD